MASQPVIINHNNNNNNNNNRNTNKCCQLTFRPYICAAAGRRKRKRSRQGDGVNVARELERPPSSSSHGARLHCSLVVIWAALLPLISLVSDINAIGVANTTLPEEHGNYLAAFGYRTKVRPQKFYNTTAAAAAAATATATHFNNKNATPESAAGTIISNDLASFNLITGAREDICKDHCKCAKLKNSFTTITCDFHQNRKLSEVFGANLRMPEDATSITIKLASHTSFRLERGFFNGNKINSFNIEGTYSENELVEITTDALRGNNGPYPEISLNNVFSVVIRAKSLSGNCKFSVRNSNDLILFPDAFYNASINGVFASINDLRIEEKAFNSAQAKLRIESSNIDNIYRFEASLREIRFINCTIGTINSGTFDVITINSIIFESCRIDVIKARAITEKLYSEHVSIIGAIIGIIESEAIYGSGITELILSRNKIDSIHENAIHVTAINATITRNNVKHLGNNWLRVREWSSIIVAKNQFGVFGRMMLDETKQPVTCRFESNSLTLPLPGSLNITNRYCVLREISVNAPCMCRLDWLHALSSRDLRSEIYCTIDDKLSFCFNATTFNLLKYMNEVCDETKTTLDCVKNMNLKKIDGVFFTPEELERRDQRIPKLIFIVAGIVTLTLLAIIAVFTAYRCCRRTTTKLTDCAQAGNMATPALHHVEHRHQFTSDDRRIIETTLASMQKKYPHLHKPINDCVQILLQRNLSDKKCIKVISNIVDLLNQLDRHMADEFVAFNRVLTQHLQPPPNGREVTPDPIYAEPGLGSDGFYTSTTIVATALPAEVALAEVPEHIYAEPHCAQQPLLRNEYASPADGHLDSMDLYTEPIIDRGAKEYRLPQQGSEADVGGLQHSGLPSMSAVSETNALQPHLPHYHGATIAAVQPITTMIATIIKPSVANITNITNNNNNNIISTSINNNNIINITDTTGTSTTTTNTTTISTTTVNTDTTSTTTTPTTINTTKRLTNVQRMAQDLQNRTKFHIGHLPPPPGGRPCQLLRLPPVYATPDALRKAYNRRPAEPRLATPEVDECEMDLRGAAALPPDSGSNHSGGSDETIKIDDIIIYADA